ncbi:undecaprenyl-diphosphate phosphatase [Pandoraea nosoerga]|uniref:Undecaprenyl-diphosphatase n=1 Tax=Pandoraea nosoerga TaxID=2508296 RepID=A0A5E4T9J4_9BURK|nr:undecaprenyl-diphosphate phosphatase [Pandoraea nosoerga]MBN4664264.1 undecaprenyl-diphosphate phosphatase [Pandoraea nosoerga]MBN4675841.1 undecaprenyl-diphosphate phosphatase [Pandoraea nosoerga]MBN4679352.1 undecaprenyl-diphosphate phosphatase [Pandoraea nosoerga]MBN4743651.1 undecaprenyl-diphosphate phosphatase [Pandoraea nosoerga]VVD83134.1 UDP pyrophosphate phosphatase [Pandoraea nosoerga]
MDLLLALKAVILGVVEGLTEFLPISSTGHLILAGSLLDFNDDKGKVFEIVIQFGAILAVCWEFRAKIAQVVLGLGGDAKARRFAVNVVVACVPAIVLGLLFGKHIKAVLFNPIVVATAFIIGGVIILLVERHNRRNAETGKPPRVASIDDLSFADALKVGLAQCLALVPGTSRSGATIIGGMMFGLERRVATEFSFFLAIPILFGATVYELYKARSTLSLDDFSLFGVGFVAAFVSAFICVRWLLRYIASHDFTAFAWYRIVFGIVVLATAYSGLVVWAD